MSDDAADALRRAMEAYLLANPHREEEVEQAFTDITGDQLDEPEPQPEQLPLVVPSDVPKARASDPDTSKRAGETMRMKGDSQRAKLLLAFYDVRYDSRGLTDEEAARASNTDRRADGNLTEFATRCSELRTHALIQFTGAERTGAAGVDREVSEITAIGIEYVRDAGWR